MSNKGAERGYCLGLERQTPGAWGRAVGEGNDGDQSVKTRMCEDLRYNLLRLFKEKAGREGEHTTFIKSEYKAR